jgi:hypothetical protein
VLSGLARDVELLAAVAGDIRQVSAIGPSLAGLKYANDDELASNFALDGNLRDSSYASLQVQMLSASAATLRWSVVPTPTSLARIELALVGERGMIQWTTESSNAGAANIAETSFLRLSTEDEPRELPPFDAPSAVIRDLETAIAEQEPARKAATSTWAKATQAMEVVDSVELSLQRGRTIEVHQQQLTEQLAFRGTMAALGCGLLLVVSFVVIVAGLLGGAPGFLQQPVIKPWSRVLLAVLAFFLLLQFVPYLSSKRRRPSANDSDSAP